MLHRAATVAAVMVGTGAGRPLRPLTIHLDFGIVEFALLGQAGEVDTRDELVREEKRYRFSEARMEPSTFDTHNCDASRRGASCQRKVSGVTRNRRATRRSRTGDLLITNSGQDETAQQYLGRLRNPDCSQIVPSRQRQSATSVIGTATNWFVIGGHPEAYVDPDDGGVGDVVCAQRSVVESPMFGTLPIVR